MDREAVGELERVAAFVRELTGVETVLVAELAGELDLELPRKSLELGFRPLVLAYHHADVAVRDVRLAIGRRPNVPAPLVKDVDHFVAVEDGLRAHRPRHLAPPTLRLRQLAHLPTEARLDH